MADSPEQKRRKVENIKLNKTECLVGNFLKWCDEVGLILNAKVTVRQEGSCHRFGMIAVEDIEEGECVFTIPRSVLLEPNTSSISETILGFCKSLPENDTRNKWLPLLVTLLYEYTNPASRWQPYLDLVPSETVMNQPIFWSEQEREYLTLIGLKDGVDNDECNIEKGYREYVVPFMEKNKQYFDPNVHTLALYKRLAGFVMAYSFTDNDNICAKPAMVPMADILNHISENNAHLEFAEKFLSMVTTQRIQKGSEVFNTYGDLDNCNLLRSYGFIEDAPNPYDEIEIPLKILQDVLSLSEDDWKCRLSHFHEQLIDDIDEEIVFNANGCVWSEQTLHTFCQIIHDDKPVRRNDHEVINNFSNSYVSQKSDENNIVTKNKNANIENEEMKDTIIVSDTNGSKPEKLTKLTEDITEQRKDGVTVDKSDSEDDDPWESDLEDGESGGDRDRTGDTNDADDSESNDDSSCDDGLSWDELQMLPVEWKQTLNRAAIVYSEKIINLSEELSRKFKKESTRTAMIKNISQGRLTILEKVQDIL